MQRRGFQLPQFLTHVQWEVEAGWSVADVSVGWGVNSQQEVVDQFEQVHIWGWPEHFLDDFDEWQTDFLWDGSQMLVPVLLKTNTILL